MLAKEILGKRSRSPKVVISSLFDVIAFSCYLLSHSDKTEFYVMAFSYWLSHCDKTKLYVIAFSYLLSHFD